MIFTTKNKKYKTSYECKIFTCTICKETFDSEPEVNYHYGEKHSFHERKIVKGLQFYYIDSKENFEYWKIYISKKEHIYKTYGEYNNEGWYTFSTYIENDKFHDENATINHIDDIIKNEKNEIEEIYLKIKELESLINEIPEKINK